MNVLIDELIKLIDSLSKGKDRGACHTRDVRGGMDHSSEK